MKEFQKHGSEIVCWISTYEISLYNNQKIHNSKLVKKQAGYAGHGHGQNKELIKSRSDTKLVVTD
jgi:hypothetical protein